MDGLSLESKKKILKIIRYKMLWRMGKKWRQFESLVEQGGIVTGIPIAPAILYL